ncbi:MAG: hypothetical protein WKG07_10955 [Hymenobacter sp.]
MEVQGKGSIFRMSGRHPEPAPLEPEEPHPDGRPVPGPRLDGSDGRHGGAGQHSGRRVGNVTISVNSTVPLYDLQVDAGC